MMIGRAVPPFAALLALAAAVGCGGPGDAPVEVSVIGETPHVVDPDRQPMTRSSAVLLEATAQGLVGFDAAGQVQPALAERWIVTNRGLSFIFRLRPLRRADGAPIDAEWVAKRLRAAIAPHSRNPLKPLLLGAIDEIEAVTPQVVDIELRSPRPDLIQLLAQPEMAILSGPGGSGPFAVAARDDRGVLLKPLPDPNADDPSAPAPASRDVRLRSGRPGAAVARFMSGQAQLVTGGDLGDLAVARAADPRRGALRFDPVAGLFGFTIATADGFLAEPDNRRALAEAIDRDRIVAAFDVPGWRAATTLVPAGFVDLPGPATPDWTASPFAVRRDEARAQVARWAAAHGPPLTLRIAVPDGPGYRLLATLVILDLRAIGVDAVRTLPGERAELTLVDAVAPSDIALWYLGRAGCETGAVCDSEGETAIEAARAAPTLAERRSLLAEADRRLTSLTPFIPIAAPVRWSLVAASLDAWRESPRGRHPLGALRTAPER